MARIPASDGPRLSASSVEYSGMSFATIVLLIVVPWYRVAGCAMHAVNSKTARRPDNSLQLSESVHKEAHCCVR